MIPSLVADELREALVEYLATTFALSDDVARQALSDFLVRSGEGIFHGPFLRVRTPFRQVGADWVSPLDWLPKGFTPFVHQARAFDRLSSLNYSPQPTLVTTGTGSGKTEAFLHPILDHCRRARTPGQSGVKALILYPMNALATDQARRIAGLLYDDPSLAGVTAGLYVGGSEARASMGPDHLIEDRNELRRNPPNILLTNYKMLDYLLVRREDRALWASAKVQYLVLDEFHTYDGAQGTDVAMLLRRLGASLSVARPGRPLGDMTPIGTSATLGAGTDAIDEMCAFAQRVFGTGFDRSSVVCEDRLTADEACSTINYSLPIPSISEVNAVRLDLSGGMDELAALFTGSASPLDPVALGELLRAHTLTRGVLGAGAGPRAWADAAAVLVERAPERWGREMATNLDGVKEALSRFVALISVARLPGGDGQGSMPLFPVEVQLWVREVSRLLRTVESVPRFRWADSGGTDDDGDEAVDDRAELPAIYCRLCGRTGWMALAGELDGTLVTDHAEIYAASVNKRARQRALLTAFATEAEALYFDAADRRLRVDARDGTVPVLVTGSEDEAARELCPSCGQADAIRFLGSRVASLASVCISQLFGSRWVEGNERKLLAFTDSVQDASHRAGFFAGRTHRFNTRTAMAKVVQAAGSLSIADIGDLVVAEAGDDPGRIHALCPPDLLHDRRVQTLWTSEPDPVGKATLANRLRFEAVLELGLRSRVGRTLELTGTVATAVALPDEAFLLGLIAEAHAHQAGQAQLFSDPRYDDYLAGLLERIRTRGAITHPWLESFIANDGHGWHIWGGRAHGMPAFPQGSSRPSFFSVGPCGDFDDITALGKTPSWLVDWAMRTLGVDASAARALNTFVFDLLAQHDVLVRRTTARGVTLYALDPRNVMVSIVSPDLNDGDDHDDPSILKCDTCAARNVVPSDTFEAWVGRTCMRYRCSGTYRPMESGRPAYYRSLYLSDVRRVIAHEHTGGLDPHERNDLEREFKAGGPTATNVLTCTPTLELGIDIGDLSAVLLTSMPRGPANYIQRVGRAGRSTGNAFVASFLPAEPRALAHLADPMRLLAGEVRPPNCYLDAVELLRRQYLAYLLDRASDASIDIGPFPREISQLVDPASGRSWMMVLLDAAHLDADQHVTGFLSLFDNLAPGTIEAVRDWAASGLDHAVKTAFDHWKHERATLKNQVDRLKATIERIERNQNREADEEAELRQVIGERRTLTIRLRQKRSDPTLRGLDAMGLLPNYTLLDDTTTIEALLWSRDNDGNFESTRVEYTRPAAIAVTELAPGNSFYTRGLRLIVDGLDIGPSSEPEYETWRLCPECGYGANESTILVWTACPRCSSTAIADAGAAHRIHRLRKVTTIENADRARVYDEQDDRERENFIGTVTVDIDPIDIGPAFVHTSVAFGAEFARRATIRTLNLGPAKRPGVRVSIAGQTLTAARFPTCRFCGVVDRARTEVRGNPKAHRGSCYVRSGAKTEVWDEPILMHELRTEAVRLLMPISVVEDAERLASFKGALLLGLRRVFGGEPEHLNVVASDFPNASGPGRRRFLVIHDSVPGGTGYLGRLADPDRVSEVLTAARQAISTCECRDSGRVACHRCLLGGLRSSEIKLVTRAHALELLDQILHKWATQAAPTVALADIGGVEESELERRFRLAIETWAGVPASAAKAVARPLPNGRTSLEIRLTAGGASGDRRWQIDEQTKATDVWSSVPDFLIKRLDARSPEIAVFLDGFQFHASDAHNHLARDATQRAALRDAGHLVWSLSWADVEAFHHAVTQPVAVTPPDRPLLLKPQSAIAQRYFNQRAVGAGLEAGIVDRNPMRLLLDYLREPDPTRWSLIGRATVTAIASGSTASGGIDQAEPAIRAAFSGDAFAPSPVATVAQPLEPVASSAARSEAAAASTSPLASVSASADIAFASVATVGGLALRCLLDVRAHVGGPNAERWTVIACLDDRDGPVSQAAHKARWLDWLAWSNLLQFVRGDQRESVITTVGAAQQLDASDLLIVPSATASPPLPSTDAPIATKQSPEQAATFAEELDLLVDDAVRRLLEAAGNMGAPMFIAGHEVDEDDNAWPLEAAWPSQRVAVVVGVDEPRDGWLLANDWLARPAVGWTPETLAAALRAR